MKNYNETAEFLNSLNIDMCIPDFINESDFNDLLESDNKFEFISDLLRDKGAFEQAGEIIYYSNAMEYLLNNDPSLKESLSIASEYGFELSNLNSEILATLLNTRNIEEQSSELEDEINEFFED